MNRIQLIEKDVARCRLCPRLVAHRERVAATKTKRFADEEYWGKAVPSFGDARARLLIVGLAPAAHGANRTGRMFTGDRSGDWLFRAMYECDFANQPDSRAIGDGLKLQDAYITATTHCAPPDNKPMRQEVEACRVYLVRELEALSEMKVVLVLGRVAFDGFLAAWRASGRDVLKPKPKFAHGSEAELPGGVRLLASFHPSQQNTFTGRLTRVMFHRVFKRARELVDS